MKRLLQYDRWCLHRLQVVLLWLEEWLSISQRQFERALIVTYDALYVAALAVMGPGPLVPTVAASLAGITLLMWVLHRKPEAARAQTRGTLLSAMARISMQIIYLSFCAICLLARPSTTEQKLLAAEQVVLLLFFYCIDLGGGGERGRRRKLAWAKLRELFGDLSWIPRPAHEV